MDDFKYAASLRKQQNEIERQLDVLDALRAAPGFMALPHLEHLLTCAHPDKVVSVFFTDKGIHTQEEACALFAAMPGKQVEVVTKTVGLQAEHRAWRVVSHTDAWEAVWAVNPDRDAKVKDVGTSYHKATTEVEQHYCVGTDTVKVTVNVDKWVADLSKTSKEIRFAGGLTKYLYGK